MNRLGKIMLLDLRTTGSKTFLVNPPIPPMALLPLILLLSFVISFFPFSSSEIVFLMFCGFMTMVTISQTYAAGEKSGMGTLHATLPLTRCDIVKARYLFFICTQAIIMFPPLLTAPFFQTSWAIIFLMSSFIIAVIYPLGFKIGFGKASYAGFALFASIVLLLHRKYGAQIPDAPPFVEALIASPAKQFAAGLILLFLSYLLSLKIYKTRDL